VDAQHISISGDLQTFGAATAYCALLRRALAPRTSRAPLRIVGCAASARRASRYITLLFFHGQKCIIDLFCADENGGAAPPGGEWRITYA